MLTQVLLDIGDRSAAAALVDQMRLLQTSLPDPTEAMRARLERLLAAQFGLAHSTLQVEHAPPGLLRGELPMVRG